MATTIITPQVAPIAAQRQQEQGPAVVLSPVTPRLFVPGDAAPLSPDQVSSPFHPSLPLTISVAGADTTSSDDSSPEGQLPGAAPLTAGSGQMTILSGHHKKNISIAQDGTTTIKVRAARPKKAVNFQEPASPGAATGIQDISSPSSSNHSDSGSPRPPADRRASAYSAAATGNTASQKKSSPQSKAKSATKLIKSKSALELGTEDIRPHGEQFAQWLESGKGAIGVPGKIVSALVVRPVKGAVDAYVEKPLGAACGSVQAGFLGTGAIVTGAATVVMGVATGFTALSSFTKKGKNATKKMWQATKNVAQVTEGLGKSAAKSAESAAVAVKNTVKTTFTGAPCFIAKTVAPNWYDKKKKAYYKKEANKLAKKNKNSDGAGSGRTDYSKAIVDGVKKSPTTKAIQFLSGETQYKKEVNKAALSGSPIAEHSPASGRVAPVSASAATS